MTDPKDPKSRILARRAKFMMATFAATVSAACASEPSQPEVCLSPWLPDTGIGDADASASDADTGSPEPCLTAPLDSGSPEDSGGAEDSNAEDTFPDDAEPTPCLKMAPDGSFD